MRATTHFHYYRSIVEALCKRGHEVKVLFARYGEWWSRDENLEPLEAVKREYPEFSYGRSLERNDYWFRPLVWNRILLNWHRNLQVRDMPRYFRNRALSILPFWASILLKTRPMRAFCKQSWVGKFSRSVEKRIPPDTNIMRQIKEMRPDLLVAPAGNLIGNSVDVEYTKAAAACNIPTVIPVISWDYLTTKGAIHIIPDRLFAWNEFHVEEAIRHHHFPRERIRITGSPMLDKWFSRLEPSSSREEFCARFGLDPRAPLVTYLGSTPNVAVDESWVATMLRDALDRETDERIRRIQIIVRPHPVHYKIYEKIASPGIVIVPKVGGVMPDSEEPLQLFYDTLYHSFAVVGINTSAMLDAIVVGKPCIAMLVEKYRGRQEKTLYFRQLMESNAADLARTPQEFLEALMKLLEGVDIHKEAREAFISEAVRPRDPKRPAGEIVAEEIEALIYVHARSRVTSEYKRS